MIHLPNKGRDQVPARLSQQRAFAQIDRVFVATNGKLYNQSYYPHSEVSNLLRAYSIHKTQLVPGDLAKCNYCESRSEHVATLQVEHYRPKAKVESGENDHIETVGYYWLGLEWTNLLLACPKCNGKNAKGNKFPIAGVRAQPHNPVIRNGQVLSLVRTHCYVDSNILKAELPILLNPEIDHPERCLTFDILGHIRGYGQDTIRGEVSKNVYRLNRDELLINRKKVWNEIKNEINLYVFSHKEHRIDEQALKSFFSNVAKKLIKRKDAVEEYTLWGRFLNNELSLMLTYLNAYYRDLFIEIYNEVLAHNP